MDNFSYSDSDSGSSSSISPGAGIDCCLVGVQDTMKVFIGSPGEIARE
jgi:hypothetical protein